MALMTIGVVPDRSLDGEDVLSNRCCVEPAISRFRNKSFSTPRYLFLFNIHSPRCCAC